MLCCLTAVPQDIFVVTTALFESISKDAKATGVQMASGQNPLLVDESGQHLRATSVLLVCSFTTVKVLPGRKNGLNACDNTSVCTALTGR
jgi:hypothetical protein